MDINQEKTVEQLFTNEPLVLYDYLLRNTLSSIYIEQKKTQRDDWENYFNLLIDKFAIHSSSFFHLSCGIIEHRKSGEQVRMNGYDIFTVNAVFRTIIETYATLHHIFIESTSYEEKEFRFLLWKIDGLTEKSRFLINEKDFTEAKTIMENDRIILGKVISKFQNCQFYKTLSQNQIDKIYKPEKKRFHWRFLHSKGGIKPLNIINLINHVFKARMFVNAYKYTSIHTHSNYYALEEFEKNRGKVLSEKQTDPLVRLSIMTTAMLIDDICKVDDNAKLLPLPIPIINFVRGMSKSIRESAD